MSEKLSSYNLEYFGNEDLIIKLYNELQEENNKYFIISGELGSGKTTYIYKVIEKVLSTSHDRQVIYINLKDYEATSPIGFLGMFFIDNFFLEREFNESTISNLNKKYTFRQYLENNENSEKLKTIVKNSIAVLAEFNKISSNIYESALKILDYDDKELKSSLDSFKEYELVKEFTEYLDASLKNEKVILIIDDCDKLEQKNRNFLDSIFKKFNFKIVQIFDENIIKLSKIAQSNLLIGHNHNLYQINKFNKKQVESILEINYKIFKDLNIDKKKEILDKCYSESKGLIYDIEISIKTQNASNNSSPNPIDILNELDLVSKQIIYILSKFKNSIDKNLILKIFMDFTIDEVIVEESIRSLCLFSFITEDNGLIKTKNELVNVRLDELLCLEDNFDIFDINDNISNVLIEETKRTQTQLFLLEVIFALKDINKLREELYLLFQYFISLYNIQMYDRIVKFYVDKVQGTNILLNIFPINILNIFLDSFQKTSNFQLGLELSNALESKSLSIYKIKYLIQTYKYDEALILIENIEQSLENDNLIEIISLKLNIYMHRREDIKAKDLLNNLEFMNSIQKNDIYYLILRNTGHLHNSEDALNNIKKSITYFKENKFYYSTCCNNFGIELLKNNETTKAKHFFEIAEKSFSELSSNEIYQSHFNLSSYYLKTNNIDKAFEYIKLGFSKVSKSLMYDILKFMNNYYLILFYRKKDKDFSMLYKNLINLYNRVIEANLDDPWLKLQTLYNLAKIEKIVDENEYVEKFKDFLDSYTGDYLRYGIVVYVDKRDDIPYLISISPHWRY